jgi:hypothetical protein
MMRRKLILAACVFVCSTCLLFSLNGCYYDQGGVLPTNCDTTQVTYSITITQILKDYKCRDCHSSPPSNGAPFSLVTYADVKAAADSKRLEGAINHANGYAPMPKDGIKMSPCEINQVEKWIADGAQNN